MRAACDEAMDRAIELTRAGEASEDPAVRYANAQLASSYVSMARELRLGSTKSRVYGGITTMPGPVKPPPVPLEEGVGQPAPLT